MWQPHNDDDDIKTTETFTIIMNNDFVGKLAVGNVNLITRPS